MKTIKELFKEWYKETFKEPIGIKDEYIPEMSVEYAGFYGGYHFRDVDIKNLLKALQGLKRGDCFCEVAIGNPMLGGSHTESCIYASKIIKELLNEN